MLVLTRKVGAEVLVPDYGIVFKVLEIRANRVRIGVSAPEGIPVYRGELWDRVQQPIRKKAR
jgi:carbon storage regulator